MSMQSMKPALLYHASLLNFPLALFCKQLARILHTCYTIIFLRHWASGLCDKLEKHIRSTTRPLLWTFGMAAVKILNEMMIKSAY